MTRVPLIDSTESVLRELASRRVLVTMWRPVVDVQLRMEVLPGPGEKVLAQSVQITPGGVDGNFAASMGSIGATVTAVGSAGNDEAAKVDFDNLHSHGVSTWFDESSAGPATVCYVLVDANGERSVITSYPDDGPHATEGVARAVRRASTEGWDLCYLGVLRAPHQEFISLLPQESTVAATVEDSDWQGIWLEQAAPFLGIVFCADETFTVHEQTLLELQERHRWILVVTSGSRGSRMIDTDGVAVDVPVCELEGPVVDTTGAGDAFASAFSAAYLLGLRGSALLRAANWYAAQKIQVSGPRNFPPPLEFAQFIVDERIKARNQEK